MKASAGPCRDGPISWSAAARTSGRRAAWPRRGSTAALALCPAGEEEVFIIGGGQLYREAMPIADRIYLTVVPLTVDGDAFFPEIPAEAFAITSAERIPGPPAYDLLIYDRIHHR